MQEMEMEYSRRDLKWLVPAVMAAELTAQKTVLESKTYRHEDLTVRTNGENRSRAILNGLTHTSFPIEMHETELAPGLAPHPAHHHPHEEMILIREGTMEVTIAGSVSKLGPGSVAFVASNEEHGWRNAGTDRAKYFVIALGQGKG
ncbi:MAG: cupin domain-containing protein [Bryobacteraceae bacterium]|nr:cupin domain-containing protein [Bryobacteraceae bacterium]